MWCRGGVAEEESWREWTALVQRLRGRGAMMRRGRIVSEPVTDYVRYEWESTRYNIAAGEDVRWLPRRRASLLAVPGNDFWLIDRGTVVFNHFTGAGDWLGNEITTDSEAIRLCATAFEAVWAAAIPHAEYAPG